MSNSSNSDQSGCLQSQKKLHKAELKKWAPPHVISVPLNMTEGKDAQWFEGNWGGTSWSVAPS
ncbi:MAG: hypothetical protein ACRBEE_06240 [Arenicella sp.]